MSLLTGFATVNRSEGVQDGGHQPGRTIEAQEQLAIASFERALALIQQRLELEAEVRRLFLRQTACTAQGACIIGCLQPWKLSRTPPACYPPHLPASLPTSLLPSRCPPAVRLQTALHALLADPVVAQCATDQLQRIKFLALKNLGDLLARRGRPGVPDALAAYCQATEVVADDALLWNKLGTLVGPSWLPMDLAVPASVCMCVDTALHRLRFPAGSPCAHLGIWDVRLFPTFGTPLPCPPDCVPLSSGHRQRRRGTGQPLAPPLSAA